MEKIQYTLYLDVDLHQQVRWLADAEGRSINGQYVQMLREGIARRLSKPTPDITIGDLLKE